LEKEKFRVKITFLGRREIIKVVIRHNLYITTNINVFMTDDSKEIERIWGQQNVPLVEVPEQLGPNPSDEEFRAGWSSSVELQNLLLMQLLDLKDLLQKILLQL